MLRAPFFLIGAYFFCGMLIAKFNPRHIIYRLIFLFTLVLLSSAFEQILIKLGYVEWSSNMHILICLTLHTIIIGIVIVVSSISK
jgi:hypothetical protein